MAALKSPSPMEATFPDGVEVERSAHRGARGIFWRFVLVVVGLQILMGAALLFYDIADTTRTTRDKLETTGDMVGRTAVRLRAESSEPSDVDVMRRLARLVDMPMALVTPDGRLIEPTSSGLQTFLPHVYPSGIVDQDDRIAVEQELGNVSGAWIVRPFTPAFRLLLVVPYSAESEGQLVYFTISAGVLGIGLALSVLTMVLAAEWMLTRPLERLVQALTSALARDVERRRHAEKVAVEARMDAEAHLAFLDNLISASDKVAIVATDENGRVQILNRAAETIYGVHDASVADLMLSDLQARANRSPSIEVPLRAMMRLQSGERFVVDPDGVEHLVALTESPIIDPEHGYRGKLMVFIDITERKRLEAELRVNEMQLMQSAKLAGLGEMATGVAHELNQPLNHIGLLSSRMIRKLSSSNAEHEFFLEKLDKIQGQVQRASKIIDQLRTFGRPKPKTLSVFAVEKPVEAVLDLFREQLNSRGIRINWSKQNDLPNVTADESQMEQVLINLINNARDAVGERCSDGQPTITIRAELGMSAAETTPRVCIHVSDNGPGMSDDVVQRIFEPFYTTKEVGKGTGLGLSISFGLVQGFGGLLSVRSEVAVGTTFTVMLRTDASTWKVPENQA